MAIFPQGLTQVDARCDTGERRVLHQLKRCLEDDYLVWHNVPIGAKARQPDFVILSPRVPAFRLVAAQRQAADAAQRQRARVPASVHRRPALLPMRDEALDDAVRLLYVAMTRSTHRLVLSAHGDSPLVQRVRAGLDAIAQRFSPATPPTPGTATPPTRPRRPAA